MKKNIIDLFAGIGGLSAAFKKDYNILFANEFQKEIAISYKANHPETELFDCSIVDLMGKLKTSKYIDQKVHGILGGPPCQGFSSAGKRNRKEFIDDPRNYLFREYLTIVQHYKPDFFIMENVPGLLTMNDGEIFSEIKNSFQDKKNFKDGAYKIHHKIINSFELGVPQTRKRLIVIGVKNSSFNFNNEYDQYIGKIKKVSLSDAISDLNYLNHNEGNHKDIYKIAAMSEYQINRRRNSVDLFNHNSFNHTEKTLARIKKIKPNENFLSLKEDIKSIHSGAYGRLDWTIPSPTITTRFDTPSAGRVIHPELHRVLTPREAARIQSFDDDVIFYGSNSFICKQIGNAVPPLVSVFLKELIEKNIRY